MGEQTKIGWTDHTFNPWVGCTKVSPACDNCYAEGWAKRAGRDVWGAGKLRQRTKTWGEPLKWNAAAKAAGIRRKVFGGSLCDVFDAEVPDYWRDEYHAKIIEPCGSLDFLLLTKRPKVAAAYYARRPVPSNVWLGTTVENQKMADLRIPDLLKVPARIRFLSVEPMLGEIDATEALQDGHPTQEQIDGPLGMHYLRHGTPRVDWIICGGESGPGHRPINPEWARSLRDQCRRAGAAFFFKQWGGRTPEAGGKILDGREHCEFPA